MQLSWLIPAEIVLFCRQFLITVWAVKHFPFWYSVYVRLSQKWLDWLLILLSV